MQQGISLDDTNRLPWLLRLRSLLVEWKLNNENGVLACSALKECYRHLLNSNFNFCSEIQKDKEDRLDLNIFFVLLNCKQNIIEERLTQRHGHPILKDSRILLSQFQTLEIPIFLTNNVILQNSLGYLSVQRSNKDDSFYYFYNFLGLTKFISVNETVNGITDVVNYLSLEKNVN